MEASVAVARAVPGRRRSSTDYLDGFRGVLIVVVLLLHTFYLTVDRFYHTPGRYPGAFPWFFETSRWFFPGMFTVALFVVVSGYCLMLPVVRSADGRMPGGILDYYRRRARRILPPYYVAALLSLLHMTVFRSEYISWSDPWTPGDLLSHLLVFYNLSDGWRFQINGPYWSLAPEWQLYLMFPIVLVPLWRWLGTSLLLGTTLAVSIGLMLLGSAACRMHPWFIFLFSVGMLAAVITEAKGGRLALFRERIRWGWVGCGLFGAIGVEWVVVWFRMPAIFFSLPPSWPTYVWNEVVLGLATAASIIHWTLVRRNKAQSDWPNILRALHHPKVMLLGRFSYSHYLVHYPILVTTTALVGALNLGLVFTLVVSYAACVPISLGLSYLFFLGVERRFLPVRLAGSAGDVARVENVAAAN